MRILPLNMFQYDTTNKVLFAEISDLGPGAMHQVYPDSIDLGVTIVSHVTGHEATFVVDREKWDTDELLYWELIPTDKSLRQNQRLAGMTIKLFND
jgi:hypothetical protein